MIRKLVSIYVKWAMIFISLNSMLFAQSKVKIYCIGQAFTSSSAMFMPEKNSYPAQLTAMLGNDFKVLLNGGEPHTYLQRSSEQSVSDNLSGLTVKRGDFVMLDLYSEISALKEDGDVLFEVQEKTTLLKEAGARVILLIGLNQLNDSLQIKKRKRLLEFAFKSETEIIDFSPALLVEEVYLDGDKALTSIGATLVARRLYELIKTPVVSKSDIVIKNSSITNFHGYTCLSFDFEGKEAKIVKPKITAEGKPWIWRARFWGHEPQLDIAMLERGYHIVYCDASERFGNEETIQLWDRFYHFIQKSGLHRKSIMEGMSRGGVYIYNWALRYPERVSAIYADAPVLDFKSWPGGKGKGEGSSENWEIFKQAYQLTEQEALGFNQSPLDRAAKIGALKIPAIHVVGDQDDIVPPDENTLPFAEAFIGAGGRMEVIHKQDIGHHPHSLVDPTPLVNFLLRAEGRKMNFAAIAAPGSEYRPGAGWHPNKGWWGEHEDIDSILRRKRGQLDILFVGNSITQGIGGSRSQVAYKPGYAAFDAVFKDYNWDCAGIAGDRTQNVLWRMMNGCYMETAPKVVVLTIGVNNFLDGDSAEEIAAGILEIKDWIQANMKETKLILTGPLPVGLTATDPRRSKYEAIQRLLEKTLKDRSCFYTPLSDVFIQTDGTLSLNDYSSDGIHLSGGYTKWAEALYKVIQMLMPNQHDS